MNFREKDIEISHLKGSGPGGQNRNKRLTGVRVVHLPTGITVVATERRSQGQNLTAALERLEEKLRKAFSKPRPRIETAPTRASRERRLKEKKSAAKHKAMRRHQREPFD